MAKHWIFLLCAIATAYGGFTAVRKYRGDAEPSVAAKRVVYSGPQLTDYKLTDQHGETFDSHHLAGHVTLTSFFFTSCPAICLRMNRQLAALAQQIGDPDLRLVSISCDPQTDTSAVLRQYAERLGADDRWTFLTGDLGYIERIGKDLYGLRVGKGEHSDLVVLSDRSGKVLGSYRVTEPEQLAKLEKLLAELLHPQSS